MAKRYADASQISHEVREGKWKPNGTLGTHHAVVVNQGDTLVVVGSVSGRVTLREGDTLGYDLGNVWMVPRPEAFRDPIRRVLALAHVPQRVLAFSSENVKYSTGYQGCRYENSAADLSTGSEVEVLGRHTDQVVPDTYYDFGDGGYQASHEVTGGDAIVVRTVASHEPAVTSRRRKVTSVVVRPDADKADVAEWLYELLVPEGQARKRAREVAAAEAAKEQEARDQAAAETLFDRFVELQKLLVRFSGRCEYYNHGGYSWSYCRTFERVNSVHRGTEPLHLYRAGVLQGWVQFLEGERVRLQPQMDEWAARVAAL